MDVGREFWLIFKENFYQKRVQTLDPTGTTVVKILADVTKNVDLGLNRNGGCKQL